MDLRFYAELVSIGVFTLKEGLPLLGNLLTTLINMDKEEHNNLPIILVFCKHCGEDFCGLVLKRVRLLADKYGRDIPKSNVGLFLCSQNCMTVDGLVFTNDTFTN